MLSSHQPFLPFVAEGFLLRDETATGSLQFSRAFFVLFLLTITVNVILLEPGSLFKGITILLILYPSFESSAE